MIGFPAPDATALFLDIDGTILDFAARPELVDVPPCLKRHLSSLDKALNGAIAFVSGRTIAEIDRLFAPLKFASAGVHGAEIRIRPDQPICAASEMRLPRSIWLALSSKLSAYPAILCEDKGFAFAIHFRAAPELAATVLKIVQDVLADFDDQTLCLLPGHCVIEIKRREQQKGRAIQTFMEQSQFRGREPIFIGDDVTDLPGFAVAMKFGGAAYSVGKPIDGTTGWFRQPETVRNWLGQLARNSGMPA